MTLPNGTPAVPGRTAKPPVPVIDLRDRIAQPYKKAAGLPNHNFLPGVDNLCLSCALPLAAPIHMVDSDAVPGAIMPGPGPQKAKYTGKGGMVALFADDAVLAGVKTEGDLPLEAREDMHVTLAYMPEAPTGERLQLLSEIVNGIANVFEPLEGVWGGTARFNPSEGSDGKPVLVALPDLPTLPELRHFVVQVLEAAGFEVAKNHGYQPHLTVAYDDNGRVRAEGPIRFGQLSLATADERFSFDLKGGASAPERAEYIQRAAAKLLCTTCGKTYFADTEAEIEEHEASHKKVETSKMSDADARACEAETEAIKERADTPEAKAVHKFRPARFTHPNGHPRCLQCGAEESISPECNREPTAEEEAAFQKELDAEFVDKEIPAKVKASEVTGMAQVLARPTGPDTETIVVDESLPKTKAFLTEVNGRTLLTAPASTFKPQWEKALTPNEHFLWVQGNFVGAEKANRNGAFWTTEDLEMGQPTVQHGPLNWLHEDRHVIGTIADAKLVLPSEKADDAGPKEPHIVAAAAIWKWIWPDEAYVVEQASDQQKLWYSMECVSREVACQGPNGCGKVFAYLDVMTGKTSVCRHVREKSSTRRFVDPTFLGAAVIVPPVRPGWADADARVMREAAALAEKAFDEAGRPDVAASEWESLMAQVVAYASR